MRQKSLYFDCHSGLDPESSISELDSRFRGNDGFGTNVKKRRIEIPPGNIVQALASGQIDAYFTPEPFGMIAEAKGVGRRLVKQPSSWCSTLKPASQEPLLPSIQNS